MAKKLVPRLPFSEVDLLIVDEMGKNISGTGMDRNVIGPRPFLGSRPPVRRIFGALSRSGKAYWDYVLQTASCEEHRLIKHGEFLDAFVRTCFTLGVRCFRLGYRLLVFGKGFSAQQSDEFFRFAQVTGRPRIGQIFVRSLTSETLGNATGLGRVDLCTTQLLEQVDWRTIFVSYLASGSVVFPPVPIHCATDREVLDTFLTSADQGADKLKIVRIKNTLQLREFELSSVYQAEAEERQDLTVLGSTREMAFNEEGNLLPLLAH